MAVSSTSRTRGDVVMLHGSAVPRFDAPVLVWWPDEAHKLATLREAGRLRLVVVQDGAEPPISGDPLEEWVRSSDSASIPDRIAGLVARAEPFLAPSLDASGVLRIGARWTPLSENEIPIARRLVDDFGSIVPIGEIAVEAASESPAVSSAPAALRQRMRRLRNRVRKVGLDLRVVPSRGYILVRLAGAGIDSPRFA
jgi:hypothetical protein